MDKIFAVMDKIQVLCSADDKGEESRSEPVKSLHHTNEIQNKQKA